jgi:glycosyltransferase involved in cell wall biosynthesis
VERTPVSLHESDTVPRICMHVIGVARKDARVMREATALVTAGYDVTVVDIEGDPDVPREEDVEGVHLRHIIMPSRYQRTRFKPFFLVKVARQTRAATRLMSRIPADAYHAHDADALLACYAVARRRHKPLIFDAHDLPYVDRLFARYPVITRLAVQRLRHITPHCVSIITVSAPVGQEFQRRYGGPTPALVRNMPPYTPWRPSNRLREALNLPATARIALYQGGIQPNRALDRTVLSAKFLSPDIVVVLLGYGPSVEPLRELVEREGLGARVRILPRVPYDELLTWTASADLGLNLLPPDYSPSIRYALPNKVFEYLMAGLPVLSTRLPAVEEVLSAYGVGQTVASMEPAEIGRAVTAMLADPEALTRMHENALGAAHKFCWEVEQQRLVDLYAHLPGVGPPGERSSQAVRLAGPLPGAET